MTKRYRFLDWSVDEPQFSRLRRALTKEGYSDETGQGFHLSRATGQEMEGRFVQRVFYVDEVVSPDGVVLAAERVGYVYSAFRLRPGRCGLALIDPPRSTSSLFQRFAQLLNYDVTIAPLKLNLVRFKRALSKQLGDVKVTSVRIAGAPLAENAIADIAVVDVDDALESALALFPEYRGNVARVELSFRGTGSSAVSISASKAGAIAVNSERSGVVDALWAAVVDAHGSVR